MISTENIKTYFKKFVKNLSAFRDNNLHNALIDYIIETYIDDSYHSIPLNHKFAYEDQVIPEEWYDIILLSNGFTKDIVSTLTMKDKFTLLSMFLDFNRYKGSVDQMKDIAYSFEDRVNIYELLLDQRDKHYTGHRFTFYNNQNIVSCYDKILFDAIDIGDYIYPGEYDVEYRLKVVAKKEIKIGNYNSMLMTYNERNLGESFQNYPKLNDFFDTYISTKYKLRNLQLHDYVNIYNNDGMAYVLITELPWRGETKEYDYIINKSWYFVPYNIYTHPDLNVNVINEEFKYEQIYPKARSFFLTKDYLNEEYYNHNIILPIKTNLILLDYGFKVDSNPINSLYSSIIFNSYKNERLVIYFKDGDYLTSLSKIYMLWYYLLYKYTGMDMKNLLPLDKQFIILKNDIQFPYKMEDIDILTEKYNTIETMDEISSFYREYFYDKFNQPIDNDYSIENKDLTIFFKSIIGNELIDYVDNRILNSSNQKLEVNFILDELYNSIITWATIYNDPLLTKHLSYFLNNLSKISYDINELTTYKLIDFLKPYHTELIDFYFDSILVHDKFNSMIARDKYSLIYKLLLTSVGMFNDYYKYKIILPEYSNINIIIARNMAIKYSKIDSLIISDLFDIFIKIIYEQVVVINDVYHIPLNDLQMQAQSILNIIIDYIFKFSGFSNFNINDYSNYGKQIFRFPEQIEFVSNKNFHYKIPFLDYFYSSFYLLDDYQNKIMTDDLEYIVTGTNMYVIFYKYDSIFDYETYILMNENQDYIMNSDEYRLVISPYKYVF